MTFAQFLIALVGPFVARVLSTLGLTVMIMGGLTAAVTTLKQTVTSNIAGMPAATIQLCGLLGIWESIGVVFGAITFIIAWKSAAGFWTLAAKA